jgi:predicted DsbA family dithiol-disulfide isomerase
VHGFADGLALDDPEVLDHLVDAAGGDPADARRAVDAGTAGPLVAASMARAREVGVTATPAWWLADRLLVPGIQPRDTMTRWVTRMQART